MHVGKALGLISGTALLAGALWWRKNPSACPYGQHFIIEPPHPFVTRNRLRAVLEPAPGEQMLEIGPGTGYYTLHMAKWSTPKGALEIFDIQQEMLNHTLRRAHKEDLQNITATQGDAQHLPYPDNTFDGAYLTAVLGEIPNRKAALQKLARVLKPGSLLPVERVNLWDAAQLVCVIGSSRCRSPLYDRYSNSRSVPTERAVEARSVTCIRP